MEMKKIEIMLKDLPDDFLMRVWDDLKHYSVGLFLGTQQLGSGTLIKCGNLWGILTAHHVLHRTEPPLDLSLSSTHKLLLVIRESSHSFEIPAKYLREIEIGIPVSDDEGPDLTFLELPQGEELGTLKAIKSFWSLDHDIENRLASALKDDGVWIKIGIPHESLMVQQESEDTVQISSKLVSYFGSATSDRRYESEGFDFVNMEAYYNGNDTLPDSFAGVSGGGLWKIEIHGDSIGSNLTHRNPIFCGVPFYQEEIIDGMRIVRCHYARSIYERARNTLLNSDHGAT
jgi:hypothetical protein